MAHAALAAQAGLLDPALLKIVTSLLVESCSKVTTSTLKELKAVSVEDEINREREKVKAADIENAIRQQKLREALRLKQELEGKLTHIKDSIDTIEMLKPPDDEPAKRKKLQDSQLRAEYYEEMQIKQQEAERKAKKLLLEQQERKRRFEEQQKKQKDLLLLEDEALQKAKLEQQAAFEEQKQAKIKAMHDKLAQRREERERLKQIGAEELQKVKATKPLHVSIEEKYSHDVLMPELEKHKVELAKKRIHFNSVTRQELQEHAKRYEDLKRDKLDKRSHQASESILDHMTNLASKNSSKFTFAVIEEERRVKEEKQKLADEKRKMAEKKKQYASLVKELHVPAVDPHKAAEIEERRKKRSGLRPEKSRAESEKGPRPIDDDSKPSSATWVPRKFKPNPLIAEAKPKKEPIKVDYLGDRRHERETSEIRVSNSLKNIDLQTDFQNLSEKETATRLIEKAQKIERAAKRQQLSLSASGKGPADIDVMGSVNDALVSSVKAKLALLDSVTRR